jgi:hypothetical protein
VDLTTKYVSSFCGPDSPALVIRVFDRVVKERIFQGKPLCLGNDSKSALVSRIKLSAFITQLTGSPYCRKWRWFPIRLDRRVDYPSMANACCGLGPHHSKFMQFLD